MTSRIFAGLAAALLLAGCATTAPEPPVSQSAALPIAGRGLAAQAGVFEGFMRRARGIDTQFSGPSDVAQSLQAGASHTPEELEAGMVAYAAMAALREPRFVAAVRMQGGGLAQRLAADPEAALDLPGGEAAAARASGALFAQGSALDGVGQQVRRAAYSVQRQAWARTKVADPAGRLARVKRLSAVSHQGDTDPARLEAALAQGARRGGAVSPVVARGVALAALSVLGEEGRGRSLMREPQSAQCLKMAKLNLYQCLASAGPQYEDIYCLGQHALIDPGQCVAEAAAGPGPRRMSATRTSYRR